MIAVQNDYFTQNMPAQWDYDEGEWSFVTTRTKSHVLKPVQSRIKQELINAALIGREAYVTLDAVSVAVGRNDENAFISVERTGLDLFKSHFRAMLEEYAGFFYSRFNTFEPNFGDYTWTKEQFKHQLGIFLEGRG